MQPQLAAKIEKATRRQFPEGINAYGTDALRFTYYSLASTGRDIKFDIGRIEGYRNFANKLWNASRYALMRLEGSTTRASQQCPQPTALANRWVLSRLYQALDVAATWAGEPGRSPLAGIAVVVDPSMAEVLWISADVLGDDGALLGSEQDDLTIADVLYSWDREAQTQMVRQELAAGTPLGEAQAKQFSREYLILGEALAVVHRRQIEIRCEALPDIRKRLAFPQ